MSKSGRIGIDVRMWSHPGIGRYVRELCDEMVAERGYEDFHFLGYQKDMRQFLSQAGASSFSALTSPIYSLSEQWEVARAAQRLPLLHVPHFNIPALRKGRLVVTVHDLIYLHDAKASRSSLGKLYAEFMFGQIQKKAAAILAVSEYTKADLLSRFPGISEEKVFVTHEAASLFFRPIIEAEVLSKTRKRYGLHKPFVLFVGSLKTHKNIPVLVEAVKAFRNGRKMDVDLMIVGRRDAKNVELLRLLDANRSFVRCLGELADEDLAIFYNLAGVFVLPSLREGFGLPVLEAMSCGTPVIVSDRTSLPEIAGTAGLRFNPERADELAALLYQIFSDRELRRRLSLAGVARAQEFSWKKTASQTLSVYEKALS